MGSVGRSALAALLALFLSAPARGLGIRQVAAEAPYVSWPRTIAIVTDLHTGQPFDAGIIPFRSFVDSVEVAHARGQCDLLVIGGDWTEDGWAFSPERGDTVMAIVSRMRTPVYWVLGNHEALPSDTLQARNPYFTAINRFPALFQGHNYWARDVGPFRLVALQTNANYQVSDPNLDYRVNNPANYTQAGGIQGFDWDGISNPASPQRLFLHQQTTSLGGRIPLIFGHRAVYGSNGAIYLRLNLSAGRGTGYLKAAEDNLPDFRRGLHFTGDQHITYLTEAIRDSHLCAAAEKGFYSISWCGGWGERTMDTTSVFAPPARSYRSYFAAKLGGVNGELTARTSEGWLDHYNGTVDPGLLSMRTGAFLTFWGDLVEVKTYRIWMSQSAGAPNYNGAGHLSLVDRQTFKLDVRNSR